MFLTHDLNSNLSLDRSICLRPLRSDIERNLFHFTIFFQKNIIKINQKKKSINRTICYQQRQNYITKS